MERETLLQRKDVEFHPIMQKLLARQHNGKMGRCQSEAMVFRNRGEIGVETV